MNAFTLILVFRMKVGISFEMRHLSALHNLKITEIKVEKLGFSKDKSCFTRLSTFNFVPGATILVRTLSKFLKITLNKYLITLTIALRLLSNKILMDSRIDILLIFFNEQEGHGEVFVVDENVDMFSELPIFKRQLKSIN